MDNDFLILQISLAVLGIIIGAIYKYMKRID